MLRAEELRKVNISGTWSRGGYFENPPTFRKMTLGPLIARAAIQVYHARGQDTDSNWFCKIFSVSTWRPLTGLVQGIYKSPCLWGGSLLSITVRCVCPKIARTPSWCLALQTPKDPEFEACFAHPGRLMMTTQDLQCASCVLNHSMVWANHGYYHYHLVPSCLS